MTSEVKVVATTAAGKEIGYIMPKGSNLFEIAFKTGGEIPKALKGGWNDIRQMKIAIEHYIKYAPKRVAKKAKV